MCHIRLVVVTATIWLVLTELMDRFSADDATAQSCFPDNGCLNRAFRFEAHQQSVNAGLGPSRGGVEFRVRLVKCVVLSFPLHIVKRVAMDR